MAEIDLNIILKLIDNASDEFKRVNAEAIKQVKELQGETKKTGEETSSAYDDMAEAVKRSEKAKKEDNKQSQNALGGLKQLSTSIRQFRSSLLAVTLALGVVTAGTREWAQRNEETRQSLEEIGLAIKNLFAFIGRIVSPVVNAFGMLAKNFNDAFGDDKFNSVQRTKNALDEFNRSITELNNQFLGGQINASQYYQQISQGQQSVLAQNQMVMESFNQLAQIQAETGNRQLLETRTRVQEQINLLNFYKENFQKAHAGMAAFVTVVGEAIHTNLSGAITDIVTGAKTAKEAFQSLGQAMIRAIVDFMAQKLVAWVLEKTLLASTTVATITAANAIAAAWLPAAILASVATLGGAAAAGSAGLSAAAVASLGILTALKGATAAASAAGQPTGALQGVSASIQGGFGIQSRAKGGDDLVTRPTLFLAGESGPERVTVSPIGGRNFHGGGDINVGGITVMYPKMSSREEVSELAKMLGNELERQLRYAR